MKNIEPIKVFIEENLNELPITFRQCSYIDESERFGIIKFIPIKFYNTNEYIVRGLHRPISRVSKARNDE